MITVSHSTLSKAASGTPVELRQHGGRKLEFRIAHPRLLEQRVGGVVADRVETVGGEERHLAAAAAADVGGAAAGRKKRRTSACRSAGAGCSCQSLAKAAAPVS